MHLHFVSSFTACFFVPVFILRLSPNIIGFVSVSARRSGETKKLWKCRGRLIPFQKLWRYFPLSVFVSAFFVCLFVCLFDVLDALIKMRARSATHFHFFPLSLLLLTLSSSSHTLLVLSFCLHKNDDVFFFFFCICCVCVYISFHWALPCITLFLTSPRNTPLAPPLTRSQSLNGVLIVVFTNNLIDGRI